MHTLQDLEARFDLVEVGHYSLRATRGPLLDDGTRPVMGPGAIEDLAVIDGMDEAVETFWQPGGGRMLVRLGMGAKTTGGDVSVGVQGEWTTDGLDEDDIPPAVEEEFINSVALTVLIPYARVAIADLALRTLGCALTLGSIRPDEIKFLSTRVERVDALPSGKTPAIEA